MTRIVQPNEWSTKSNEITTNALAHIRSALAMLCSPQALTHLSIVCDICCCCSGIGCWIFIALEPPSFCLCCDDGVDVVANVACLYWLSAKNSVNIGLNRPAQISFGLIVSTSQCRSRNAFKQLFTFSNCRWNWRKATTTKIIYFRICLIWFSLTEKTKRFHSQRQYASRAWRWILHSF